MKFKFDEEGHIVWKPRELYQMALENPLRLVNDYLMGGSTPKAFDEYERYCDFVEAVAERIGVHPRNLYLRGSCQIGYSIAPRAEKVWTAMSDESDLDLVIVDRLYFERFEKEIRRWENEIQFMLSKGESRRRFLIGNETGSSIAAVTKGSRQSSASIIVTRWLKSPIFNAAGDVVT
ncbi:MAG: hypothetical protein NT069_10370 [Planctomycetota bacterium]|nr:hypothetical protein [Planctomycetota bacterium]